MPEHPPKGSDFTIARPDDLGKAIVESRRRAGLTQAELAEWLEVSRYAVQELETEMQVRRLQRIIDALDVLGLELVVRAKRAR